jgi:hypothetical protein
VRTSTPVTFRQSINTPLSVPAQAQGRNAAQVAGTNSWQVRTVGRYEQLAGINKHSPLLDTHTLDFRDESKINSRREVCNRSAQVGRHKQLQAKKKHKHANYSAVSYNDILKKTFYL